MALVSNVLVDAITGAAEDYHISSVFICAVLIPIAGNAAEHGAAVIFAYRNQMDIALGIALGSATQVLLFVLPVCVLLGWVEDQPMTLYFQPYVPRGHHRLLGISEECRGAQTHTRASAIFPCTFSSGTSA